MAQQCGMGGILTRIKCALRKEPLRDYFIQWLVRNGNSDRAALVKIYGDLINPADAKGIMLKMKDDRKSYPSLMKFLEEMNLDTAKVEEYRKGLMKEIEDKLSNCFIEFVDAKKDTLRILLKGC